MTTESEQHAAVQIQDGMRRAERVAELATTQRRKVEERKANPPPALIVYTAGPPTIFQHGYFSTAAALQQHLREAGLKAIAAEALQKPSKKLRKAWLCTTLPHYVVGFQALHAQGVFDVVLITPQNDRMELDIDGDFVEQWPDEFLSLEFNMRFQHGSCAPVPLTDEEKLAWQLQAGCRIWENPRMPGRWMACWVGGVMLTGEVDGYEETWYFGSEEEAQQALIAGYENPDNVRTDPDNDAKRTDNVRTDTEADTASGVDPYLQTK